MHRDVKPGNILVDSRRGGPEHAYLTDFGIARAMLSAGTLTVAGQFLGTPDYAAPEQVSGQPVDGRADQYALACVAFELLGGTVPFKRELPIAVLYAHLSTPPPRLTATRQDLPPAVDAGPRQGHGEGPGTSATTAAPTSPTRCARRSASTPTTRPSAGRPPRPMPMTMFEGPVRRRPAPPVPDLAVTWTAVVTADRDYYDQRPARSTTPDSTSISFPDDLPERRIPLSGGRVRIGRRSDSRQHPAGNRPDRPAQGPGRLPASTPS